MTSPITRRLLRQADEAEAGSPYPTRPIRCAARIIRHESTSHYAGLCKRTATRGAFCWQHERSATR